MLEVTHLSTRGQVVIPLPIRQKLKWKKDLKLKVTVSRNGRVVLTPITK